MFEFPKTKLSILNVLMCCGLASCGSNIFKEAANKNTDAALYKEAQILLDAGNYTESIAKIQLMTSEGQAARDTLNLLASAYAARCGLEFFPFLENLGSATGELFQVLMQSFPASDDTSISDCVLAESAMVSIGGLSERTASENLFLAFVSMAKIGVILNRYADTDNDGTVDGAYDYCTTVPDDNVKHIVTGLSQMLLSLAASGSSAGGSTVDVGSVCSDPGLPEDPCATTDVASVTNNQVAAMRSLVGSQDSPGLGSCADTLANCLAACPP